MQLYREAPNLYSQMPGEVVAAIFFDGHEHRNNGFKLVGMGRVKGNRFWTRPIVLWATAAALAGGIFLLTAYSGYLARTYGQAEDTAEVLESMLRSLPVWGALWAGFVALFLVRYRGGARLMPLFGSG